MNGNLMNGLMQILSMGSNPQQIVTNMIRQNPQANAVISQAQQSGMSMEQFARQYAKQNGIDLEPILNTLRQRGMRV